MDKNTKIIKDKKEIRQEIFAYWKNLPEADRHRMQVDLYAQLFTNEDFIQAKTITTTIAHPGEIDTQPIIDYAFSAGKTILVPKTYPKRQMKFAVYEGIDKLERTAYGILEPKDDATFVEKADIDLVIVPGLFFTPEGYRIGHGGGFYDIFLSDYSGKKIALAFSGMTSDTVDFHHDDFDVPMDTVLFAE